MPTDCGAARASIGQLTVEVGIAHSRAEAELHGVAVALPHSLGHQPGGQRTSGTLCSCCSRPWAVTQCCSALERLQKAPC